MSSTHERTPGLPGPRYPECLLGKVVAVNDPDSLGRVQVRIYSFDGVDQQDAAIWARVAVPVAGASRGTFLLPDVDDEVLISFVGGDPNRPVVIGSLWNGRDTPTERLGGSGDAVDRWTFTGRNGTRISIIEEQSGQAKLKMELQNGVFAELKEEGGGKIELSCNGSTVKLETSKITLQTGGTVEVQASRVNVSAGQVSVDAAMASFSGVVRCTTLQATTVVGTTYTPGAGNIW